MKVRVIVCGGRDFGDEKLCFDSLDQILADVGEVEIVSGGAKGADSFGEKYAKEKQIEVSVFKAEWNKYGRAAGPVRNKAMLDYILEQSPMIIAFWDGKSKGTKNMIEQAKKAGAKVHIVNY